MTMRAMQFLAMVACLTAVFSASPSRAFDREVYLAHAQAVRKIHEDGGIESTETVVIGGVPQVMTIRGRDRTNPVLLFLHGGPGSSEMRLSHAYQGPLEEYFTVVQWDQRSAGRTFVLSEAAKKPADTNTETMTVDRMVHDAEEVVLYLRRRLGQGRIVVVGHSWGTVLGVNLVSRRPEWISAYVGVGQVVAMQENERASYAFAKEEARRRGDMDTLGMLEALSPYPGVPFNIPAIIKQREVIRRYGGMWAEPERNGLERRLTMLSPDYSDREVEATNRGTGADASVLALLPELSTLDLRALGTTFSCPMFIFAGARDQTTPSSLARAYYDTISAPQKGFVLFERSAHMVQLEEPGRFVEALVTHVRPLAVAGQRSQ